MYLYSETFELKDEIVDYSISCTHVWHALQTLDSEILEKNSSKQFLEFVAAKFNFCLAFVQLFTNLYWMKIRIYIVFIMC